MRHAIVTFLKTYPEIEVVAQAENFLQTIQLVDTFHPQVVVMDVYMKDTRDISASQIKTSLAGSKVLAISFANDVESKVVAESYGAVAVLDKTKLVDELIPAIELCVKE
jgi:DNA-binding NarL/FixJ family response regulator